MGDSDNNAPHDRRQYCPRATICSAMRTTSSGSRPRLAASSDRRSRCLSYHKNWYKDRGQVSRAACAFDTKTDTKTAEVASDQTKSVDCFTIVAYHCRYAVDWIVVKAHWELTATEDEWDALGDMLQTCDGPPEIVEERDVSAAPTPAAGRR